MDAAWTAPAAQRPEQPLVADERDRLTADLDFQRATLLSKCAGLTGEQLARRPVPSSELSLLGLVRHMAANERIWFRIRFARQDVDDLYADDGDFDVSEPDRASADFAALRTEMEEARRAVAGHPLEETFGDETHTVDLRWLFSHMIDEYARHNGHADIIRELVDGVTGY